MEYLSTFNFDIIIVLVLIASIIAGAYYSLYRQIRKTLVLIVPLVALYFVLPPLMTFIKSTSAIYDILVKIISFVGRFLKLGAYQNIMISGLIGLISFVIMALMISFIFQLFTVPIEKRVLRSTPWFSRVVGGLFGLIKGYVLIILILLFMKPIADINYHKPFTKVIVDTSLVYLPVSKLNEVQNVNVALYQEYQEAFDHVSGNKVLATLNFLDDVNDQFIDLDTYIDTTMLDQLSADSQTLITTHLTGTDYLTALLTDVDGTLVIDTVLTDEKNNPNIATIKEKLTFLLSHRGYWVFLSTILTNPINTYEYDEISQAYRDNQESLLELFPSLRYKNEFVLYMQNLSFFENNFLDFKTILADETITDFASYQISFQDAINNHFSDYATSFTSYAFAETSPTLISLRSMFSEAMKYETNLALMDINMSLPTRVILGKRYDEWFTNPLWETEVLINSYCLDSLGSYQAQGNNLYSEYFFFNYLSEGMTFDDLFSIDDLEIMLTNLEVLVNDGLLAQTTATGFIDSLFQTPNSLFVQMNNRSLLTNTFLVDASNLSHPYLSSEFVSILESFPGA
ncbi:MAG: CvpA family protein [Bacilli bacterium]